MWIELSDEDLDIAKRASRSLANIYKRDAAKQANPLTANPMLEHAARCERMAERIRRYRERKV